ncbi:MAG: pyruvate formate lyase family protein, partial [Candidatus Hodarchaeota archaeon]
MSSAEEILPREVKGKPSTERSRKLRDRYLSEPLILDAEYIYNYMLAHKKTDGFHLFERRAECHAFALENLTPKIRDGELLVGSKTRYVRGAIPYCNYASNWILRAFAKEEQEAQDKVTDLGEGGGIAKGRELLGSGDFELFSHKFLVTPVDQQRIKECAEYFKGKCMQDVGDAFWKSSFSESNYIEKGWQAVLYTAPHDPAPEGRFVLDFDAALSTGFNGIIQRLKEKIAQTTITDYRSAEKVYFWRAGIRVLQATINWANNYANEAKRLAAEEINPIRKQELNDIGDRCRRVPANPPSNFLEAMQAFWFIYLAGHIEGSHLGYSPGRFDRYMYPFYKADALISDAEVLELLELLRVKMTEIEYVASFSWEGLGSGNLFQNMMLGGTDENGRPADNELSMLILQAAINCQTIQPTLSIWYDDSLSDEFLLKA